jgi:hypothetical protein
MEHHRIADDSVRSRTGRGWAEWFELLDAANAAELDHPGIVALLAEHPGVSGWWRQSIAVAYEQARGLRAPHEKTDGFEISASRTIGVPLATLYQAWSDPSLRAAWLEGDRLDVTSSRPERSLRGRWGDAEGRIDVGFAERGDRKSKVALNHGRLRTAEDAARFKSYWTDRLARLKAWLEGMPSEG